jgi:hypothetical protein
MANSLLERGILCFKRGIGGDVLRHVFSPNDFLRKQIKAEGEKIERRQNTRPHEETRSRSKENSLSNRVFLWGAVLLGLLAFVHGFGVFFSGAGEKMRSDG